MLGKNLKRTYKAATTIIIDIYNQTELKVEVALAPTVGFICKYEAKKLKSNTKQSIMINPIATTSKKRSTKSVPKVVEKGTLSYLVTAPQRQTSPARGNTKFTA